MVDFWVDLWQAFSWEFFVVWWIIVFVSILGRRLRTRCFPHLYQMTGETITSLDDAVMLMLCQLGPWFYLVSWIWIASRLIALPDQVEMIIQVLFTIVVIAQLGQWVITVILQLTKEKYFNNQITHNFTLLNVITNIFFWIIIVLLILSNLDIKITPLLASLGVFWIAVSFALQNILEDLFASVSIYLDKPFRIGDYITMGEHGWSVEQVWIKTTRVRTILWEELVIANRKLTESVLHNYWKINLRTNTLWCMVSLKTSAKNQTRIPNIIKKSCEFSELINFQRCHLIKIWEYGLEYQRRYTLQTSDYNTHLQIQEKILMNVLAEFEKYDISIARPVRIKNSK